MKKAGKKVLSGIFPVTYFLIGDPPEDPKTPARAEHGTRQFLKNRIIFMSMFNDIDWTREGNDEHWKMYAKRFSEGHWKFFGLGEEKNWFGNCNDKT